MLDIKHYQKGQKYVSRGDGLKEEYNKTHRKGNKFTLKFNSTKLTEKSLIVTI